MVKETIIPFSKEAKNILAVGQEAGFQAHISEELPDLAWEEFLKSTPTSRHFQSSIWAQTKTEIGWRSARILITHEDQIVAGAQVLIRSIPLVGKIAYISRGPVIALQNELLLDYAVFWIHQAAQLLHLDFLLVQPPYGSDMVADHLLYQGFKPSLIEVAPTATVLVDLHLEIDDLLSNMTKRTRQYIRGAEQKGVVIREGTEEDIPVFFHLLELTAKRKSWSIYRQEYYLKMWRHMNPHKTVRLTLAEYQGKVVSALLAYGTGEAVYGKTLVREVDNNLGTSEYLVWESLRWSKAAGFRYYDFGRIWPKYGAEYIQGTKTLGSFKKKAGFFKLRLGGEVAFCPGAYYYIYKTPLRRTFQTVYPRVKDSKAAKKVIKSIRGYEA